MSTVVGEAMVVEGEASESDEETTEEEILAPTTKK